MLQCIQIWNSLNMKLHSHLTTLSAKTTDQSLIMTSTWLKNNTNAFPSAPPYDATLFCLQHPCKYPLCSLQTCKSLICRGKADYIWLIGYLQRRPYDAIKFCTDNTNNGVNLHNVFKLSLLSSWLITKPPYRLLAMVNWPKRHVTSNNTSTMSIKDNKMVHINFNGYLVNHNMQTSSQKHKSAPRLTFTLTKSFVLSLITCYNLMTQQRLDSRRVLDIKYCYIYLTHISIPNYFCPCTQYTTAVLQ